MIKLSELPMDAMLTISPNCCDGDLRIMDKANFLQSAFFLDGIDDPEWGAEVTLAQKTVEKFNLWDAIGRIGEDTTYEGWDQDVYNALKNQPETIAFLALVKQVFEGHPTYWEGEPVEVDMEPEPVPEVFDVPDYLFRRVRGSDACVYAFGELPSEDKASLIMEINAVKRVQETGKPGRGIYDPFMDAMFSVMMPGADDFVLLASLNNDQLDNIVAACESCKNDDPRTVAAVIAFANQYGNIHIAAVQV